MSGICDTCQRNQVCRRPMDGMDSCRLYVSGRESNYEKLFGTPERAARTLHSGGTLVCRECLIREECAETPEDGDCMIMDYDALLEWLRGDE